ncbi:MAG: RsbRD N-terminal domain-containing protein [Proteobacteria bacterium]|nr:RsbRD N-terminal domain-containing protein [Pseudomonadota bacterium]
MSLQDKIKQKKKAISERCFNLIAGTYPAATSQLLKREKDRFLNPVGYTIQNEMETIFDELTGEMNSNRLYTALESIIKIRAVQDFSPSEAIGFVFLLKAAVREETTKERVQGAEGPRGRGVKDNEAEIFEELHNFEQRIDRIALMAFDIYMECREKIYEIKTKEIELRAKVNYGK